MDKKDLLSNKEIKLAILLKTQQLKREELGTLTPEHLYQTLTELVWKYKYPKNIHTAVNDIMSLDVATIVSFLSIDAIKKGSDMNMDDLKTILKGE